MRRFYIVVCVLISAGCSQLQVPSATLPAALQPAAKKAKFVTLYSFKGEPDGAVPVGGVASIGGTLYGTTNFGGDSSKGCYPGNGCGVVFAVTATGSETVLYRFQKQQSGQRPYAGVTASDTTLYGTTERGGKSGNGALFAITPTGGESTLFSFAGVDGQDPRANLLDVNGTLYGTTYSGGRSGVGTVFSLAVSSKKIKEKTVHAFSGNDGALPIGNLIQQNGVLYGTTVLGGASNSGTVFAIGTTGQQSVLYSFTGGADGAQPFAGLTALNGVLYGTTSFGGSGNKGAVFSIGYTGVEAVIHSFAGGADGAEPLGGLVDLNGTLYGTTERGGATNNGVIYAITPTGTETVVHTFKGTDGSHPTSSLTVVGNTLYGTTTKGGDNADGTVFSFTP